MAENSFTPEQIQAMNAFADALNSSTRAMGPKADADREAADAANSAKQRLKDFGEQLGRSAVDVAKNIVTGGEGTGKFAGAVTSASDAAGSLAQKLGPLGFVVGGLIKIFGAVAAASLKQNDTIMRAYRDLAEAGDVGGSLEKLKEDLGKVGLTSDEVDKFGSMIKKYTPDIAAFGGSVSAGKDKLIGVIQGMIGPDNQIERAMSRMGYGAEEMRDATADYISKQARLGVSQVKTEEQLRNESVKYMQTLRELQELTGMSRDEAQKVMDEQQRDYRTAAFLRELELKDARDGTQEAKNLREYMAGYQKTYGKQMTNDLYEQMYNGGQAATEGAQRSMLSTQNKGYENAMKARKGEIDMYDGLKDTAAGMRRNMDQLGNAYNLQGQQLNLLTGSEEGLLGMMMMEGKTREEIAKKFADDQNKEGDRLAQNTRMEQQQRALRIAADKAMWDVGSATVSIFQKINNVVFAFGKALATIIDFITGIVPFVKQTNYAASFRSNDDVQTDKTLALREKEQLLAEKERLNKESETNGVDKATLAKQIQASQAEITKMQQDAKGLKGTDAENARLAIAEKQRQLKEQEQLAKDISNGNKEAAIIERKKKLIEIEERLQAEDKRLQELEQENLYTGGNTTGQKPPIPSSSSATKFEGSQKEYYDKMYNILLADAKKKNLENPEAIARLGASQSSLETGYGKHILGNNHFGIKSQGGKGNVAATQEWDPKQGRMVTKNESFRGYSSMEESAADYIDFLQKNKERYEKVLSAKTAEDAIREQGKTGYATDPNYGSKLANINEKSKLPQASGGGIFTGPTSGYPVMLHGKEAVVPMPNMQNFMDEIKKESLSTFDSNNQNSKPTTVEMPKIDFSGLEQLMSETLVGKFEDMINQLESANDTLNDILKHAKA